MARAGISEPDWEGLTQHDDSQTVSATHQDRYSSRSANANRSPLDLRTGFPIPSASPGREAWEGLTQHDDVHTVRAQIS